MSHFVVAVLMQPQAADDHEAEVRRLLAPYDENTDVPAYMTQCWCVGHKAGIEAAKAARESIGDVDVFRASFKAVRSALLGPAKSALHDFDLMEEDEEAVREAWRKHIAPLEEAERATLAAHPLKGAADPACAECKGSGQRESTRNPKSKWDWWTIGGRWSGFFSPEGSRGNPNVPAPFQLLARGGNVALVSEVLGRWDPKKHSPFAVVTPDGEWHERGRMGWFACVSDEKKSEDWRPQARSLLEAHRDCIVVAVDCHI